MDLESSFDLLQRVKAGDADAVNRLLDRYCLPLKRWAHGRLPRWARDMSETQDLVQDVIVQTLKNLDHFEAAREGALHAYLRRAVLNRIRDELRRVGRRPARTDLDQDLPAAGDSPLAMVIKQEALKRYESALAQLREDDREALIARLEFGLAYEDIAAALGRPSPDAARVAVRRAIIKLTEIMNQPA